MLLWIFSLFLKVIHCMNLDKYYILYVLKVGEVFLWLNTIKRSTCWPVCCCLCRDAFLDLNISAEFIDACFSCRSFRSWSLSTWRRSSRRISSSRTSGLWSLTLQWVCAGALRASSCSAWIRPDGTRASSGVCLWKCLHTAHASCIEPLSFRPHRSKGCSFCSANKHGRSSPAALNSGIGTIWSFSHSSDVAKTLRLVVIIICLFACFCLWVMGHVGKMSQTQRFLDWRWTLIILWLH